MITLLLSLIACGGPPPMNYTTAVSEQGDLSMEVTAVGTLAPLNSVEIGSDQTGQVLDVLVEPNDTVTAGQVLARLDPKPFEINVREAQASVSSARASVHQAQANLEKAQTDRDRTARLVERGAATQTALLDLEAQVKVYSANLEAAQAQLSQARSALEQAQENLEDTVITSSIDGVVLLREVEPGQTVVSSMSATTLFEIASDLSRMQADVDIDEADVARVAAGQSASFSVSAWPSREFDAQVARVDLSPDPDSSVVVYVAELHLDNPDGALRPGMTVTARIETGRVEDVVLVPSAALRFAPRGETADGASVWLSAPEGPPSKQPVTVLGSDGMQTAVSGLEPGVTVITGGGM